MIRHIMEVDYNGRNEHVAQQPYHPKTFKQVMVGTLEKKIELSEESNDYSSFDFKDFSLQSIIASGNTDLLNPVGRISDSSINASDNADKIADQIENFSQHLNTEENG